MTRKKTIAAFVTLATTVALAPAGAAFAFGGGMAGGGVSGLSTGAFAGAPIGNIGANTASVVQVPESTIAANPDNVSVASYDGELPIAGRVAPGSTFPQGATLVQLRVNGRIFPMALDTQVTTADLDANPTDNNNKALYNAVQCKKIVVIGNAELRNQIASAADSSKPL